LITQARCKLRSLENSIEAREREELATELRPQIIAEVQEQVVRRIRAILESDIAGPPVPERAGKADTFGVNQRRECPTWQDG